MNNKTNIFGIQFDNLTVRQIAALITGRIRGGKDGDTPLVVFTPNPEIVIEAGKDSALLDAMSRADIVSADGIGIVWASKYFGNRIRERASGYDIVQEVFKTADDGLSAFFLGGSEDAVTKAAVNMEKKYGGICVCGTADGYFKQDEEGAVITRINSLAPDLLLVGLGSPKQEKWAAANAGVINAKVIIVVGGSFDVMSGNIKRAPVFFRRLGLEWFYRLVTQPKRFKRMLRLPIFVFKVLRRALLDQLLIWRKNAKKKNDV